MKTTSLVVCLLSFRHRSPARDEHPIDARQPYLLFVVAGRYYVLLAEGVGLAHFFSWGQ